MVEVEARPHEGLTKKVRRQIPGAPFQRRGRASRTGTGNPPRLPGFEYSYFRINSGNRAGSNLLLPSFAQSESE